MNVEELYSFTLWIKKAIADSGVAQRYQELSNILQHNSQQAQKKSFEAERERLFGLLKAVPYLELDDEQFKLLHKLNILQLIGPEAIQWLEDVLFRNSLDITTAWNTLLIATQKLNSTIQWSSEVQQRLQPYFEPKPEEGDRDYRLRVTFTREAHLRDVQDFKEWGAVWFDIGRGIAMAHGLTPQDVRVVGASKGSVIIELGVVFAIAKTVSKILNSALDVAFRVVQLRQEAEKLRGMQLKNDQIAADLEKEAEAEKIRQVTQVTNEIITMIQIDRNGDGEKVTALERSITKLVDFVDKGGEIDCVVPDDAQGQGAPQDNAAEIRELREAFKEIRALEQKIYRIGHDKPTTTPGPTQAQ